MHKLSHTQKLYLDRKSRRLSNKAKWEIRFRKKIRVFLRRRAITITSPGSFFVREAVQRRELMDFLTKIDSFLASGFKVKLQFDNLKLCHPCGTIVWIAFLDKWTTSHPGMLSASYPRDDVVEQLFQHFGVLDKLGLTNRKKIEHERVIHWFSISGTKIIANEYRDLSLSVRDAIEHPHAQLFVDCLNEAVTNAVNHAYKHQSEAAMPSTQRKWWVFSQRAKGRIYVAIYDLGSSIPDTLQRDPHLADIFKGRKFKDPKLIRSAVSSWRTSTGFRHRGKGLPEMLEFSQDLKSGGLSILSRRGAWAYNADTEEESSFLYETALPGTLVMWELPFREDAKNEPDHDLDS